MTQYLSFHFFIKGARASLKNAIFGNRKNFVMSNHFFLPELALFFDNKTHKKAHSRILNTTGMNQKNLL
jgi:hypothetical protein